MSVFASAAQAFARLVRALPAESFAGAGLGDWDLRALVGHASRSLITVSSYLRVPATTVDIGSPAEYYTAVRGLLVDGAAVVERGRQAGRDLGETPAATVDRLVAQALADVASAGDPLITVIGGLGIRLSDYLPTRVFELAVHSLDIARATGIEAGIPADVLAAATTLAGSIAAESGHGETVLLALTGRTGLPVSFSVV